MTTAIQNFDVTEHIRGRVREVLIASIPDDQIDLMLKSELESFFKPKRDSYSNRETPSPFANIVHAELQELIKAKLTRWLDSNFQNEWDSLTNDSKLVGDLVAHFVPIVQQRMAQNIVESALSGIRNSIR